MLKLLPDLRVDSISKVDLDALSSRGIRGLIVDLDNTVVRWNRSELSRATIEWFQRARARGMRACIVSNAGHSGRVERVAARLGACALARAGKPGSQGYLRAMQQMGTSAAETAVIGDQLPTDVWGGNRLGLFTILVRPIGWWEFPPTKLNRILEWLILSWAEWRSPVPPS
jgi:hypothetical protein